MSNKYSILDDLFAPLIIKRGFIKTFNITTAILLTELIENENYDTPSPDGYYQYNFVNFMYDYNVSIEEQEHILQILDDINVLKVIMSEDSPIYYYQIHHNALQELVYDSDTTICMEWR